MNASLRAVTEVICIVLHALALLIALPLGVVLLVLFSLIDLVCRRDRRIVGGGRR